MKRNKQKYGWWKNAVFYQVYPKSFQDTNGDGVTPPNEMKATFGGPAWTYVPELKHFQGSQKLIGNYPDGFVNLRPYEAYICYYENAKE